MMNSNTPIVPAKSVGVVNGPDIEFRGLTKQEHFALELTKALVIRGGLIGNCAMLGARTATELLSLLEERS